MNSFKKMITVSVVAACAVGFSLLPANFRQAEACVIAISQLEKCSYITIGSGGLECGINTVRLGVSDEGRDDCNAIEVRVEVEDPSILSFDTTEFSFPDDTDLPEGISRGCNARLTEVDVTGLKEGKTKIHFSSRPLGYTDREFELVTSQTVGVSCDEEPATTTTTTTVPSTDLTVEDLKLLIQSAMLKEEFAYNDLLEVLEEINSPDFADNGRLQGVITQLEEADALLTTATDLARQLLDASQITIATAFMVRGTLSRALFIDRFSTGGIRTNMNHLNNGTRPVSRIALNLRIAAGILQQSHRMNQTALDTLEADTASAD